MFYLKYIVHALIIEIKFEATNELITVIIQNDSKSTVPYSFIYTVCLYRKNNLRGLNGSGHF